MALVDARHDIVNRRGCEAAHAYGRIVECVLVLTCAALLTTGCNAGGGRSSSPGIAPKPDGAVSEEDLRQEYATHPEFRNQAALSRIGAHYAYARGATGEGVALGIVDSGVDPGHPSFEGKLETDNVEGYEPDFGSCEDRAPDGSCLSMLGHGTFVAGIMAANRREHADGAGSAGAIHGVAFDAKVISVGFRSVDEILEEILPENPTPEEIRDLPERLRGIESVLEMQFASAFNGLNSRVTAVNCSFGLPGNIEDFGAEELRGRFPNVIGAIAQADTPASARSIYVWAAGTARGEIGPDGSVESASSVEIAAGLPVRIPELRGHSLAVAATDPEGRIADFSNRCGIAKEFCLAAPGVGITGPAPGPYCPAGAGECWLTFEESGTSSAAPFVTGGIALLAQHYRNQLGNDEIVERILETADKEGIYGDSDVYGQGFLDLDAATRPVGETRMLTGRSLSGPSAPSLGSTLRPGAAFGDSLTRGLAVREVASFDELDAPFFRPLSDHLRPNVLAASSVPERLGRLGRDPRGASWRMDGAELRARLNAASTPTGLASLGSLSMTRDLGNGRLLLGYRSHPGWRFGLHANRSRHGPGPVEPGAFTDDGAFANPFLGFARDGASIGYETVVGFGYLGIVAVHGKAQYGERRDAGSGKTVGALMEYRLGHSGSFSLAVETGWLAEERGLLGSRSRGAFGGLSGDTSIVGVSAHRQLTHGWTLLASAHAGVSRAGVRGHGMVRRLSALRTSSLAFGVMGEEIGHAGGRLAFRLSQPLRVEAGHAQLRWVSGRTPGGQVEVEQAVLELEPSGRQLDLELIYARPWAGGQTHVAVIASRDARHVQGETEAVLLMRYSRQF